ncbi:MAG: diadenylate cyclase CdaA [Candidatus Omnitrophica bacterium]|nr:diadenylate cyclase CdaA [Candidatus Omnitrophota bacterium]
MSEILWLWKPLIEIAVLWFVIYHIMLFFEGTRALQVLRGIVILIASFFISQRLGLTTIDWLLAKLFGISIIAIFIIFQPEIRHGLARLGQRHLFDVVMKEEEEEEVLAEVADAATLLAEKKIGALIALAKESPLRPYIESGVILDSRVSSELLQAIFSPTGLLHDGGVIIQQGRIVAAGCLFPLTEKPDLSRSLGTRHRAALGLSEDTDAVVIVVSEESGNITIAYKGRLLYCKDRDYLLSELKFGLQRKEAHG